MLISQSTAATFRVPDIMLAATRIPGWPQMLQALSERCCSATRSAVSTHLGTSMPAPASLDEIMKLDEVRRKPAEEVETIWMQVRNSFVWCCCCCAVSCLAKHDGHLLNPIMLHDADPCHGVLAGKHGADARHHVPQFHLDDNKQRAGAVLPGPLWRIFEARARAS